MKCLIWALLTIWKKLCATCLLKDRRCCFPQPCRARFEPYQKYMKAPKNVTVSKEELTVPLIEQYYFETKDKVEGLCRLLDAEIDGKIIIFCRTKKGVDDLAIALASRGYMAEGLHGDLSQTQRDRVMKKFREGTADILIATDVAARGIDIDNITHVINFDIPQDPEVMYTALAVQAGRQYRYCHDLLLPRVNSGSLNLSNAQQIPKLCAVSCLQRPTL